MIELDWEDCLEKNTAKKVTPDIKRAESLLEVSNQRLSLIKELDDKNCNFVFEDYYTSILEILQAIIFKKGFNVMNHIGLGYYLRDVVKREDLYRIFDDLRYKRNSLTYYGNRMDFETSKQAIERAKQLIKELNKLL
jgi:uncharacterized protein (UPF0332 family)